MTIKETRWRPDTCGCIFVYAWDDEAPNTEETPREHTFVRAEKICLDHSTLPTELSAYNAGLADNQNKNKTINHIKDTFGIGIDEISYTFSGMGNSRVLHISISGMMPLTALQRMDAQAWADSNIGASKVIVE